MSWMADLGARLVDNGYPVLPIIYILMGISFCTLLIIYKPQFTWPGLIITLCGIPLYYLAVRNRQSTE